MNNKTYRVAVLFGGTSSEREISLRSGNAVMEGLRSAGHDVVPVDIGEDPVGQIKGLQVDLAFIALHGRGGEDGQMQALLTLLGIPFTGSGVMASAIGMDKFRTKLIWRGAGLPTPDYAVAFRGRPLPEVTVFPVFVKPAHEGSSIGINRVDDPAALPAAIEQAFAYDNAVLIEHFIDGDEYTCSILEGKALPLISLKAANVFYDYEAKYAGLGTTEYLIPCGLSEADEKQAQALCEAAFDLVGCTGWGRVDLMRDKAGQFWLLEVNTVPGMTNQSLVPKAAAAMGIDFVSLVDRLVRQAVAS